MTVAYSIGDYRVVIGGDLYHAIGQLYFASSLDCVEYHAALYGLYSNDGKTVYAVGLCSLNIGAPTSCENDTVRIARSMRCLWESTQGARFYIGDWHSHPNESSAPSGTDLSTLSGGICEQCKSPVMLISGKDGLSLSTFVDGEILLGELEP